MKKQNAIALVSGGPDSATAAYLRSHDYKLSILNFNYGQNQALQEAKSAELIAKNLNAEFVNLNVSNLSRFFIDANSDFFTDQGPTLGHGEAYDALPYIFGWAYSIAASYCLLSGTKHLIIGINALDVELDPQFREEALRSFEHSVRTVVKRDFILDVPFINQSKSSVLKIGDAIGVPLHETWSCLNDGDVHCGECRACERRQQAFYIAKIEDRTKYKNPANPEKIDLPKAKMP